MDCLLFNEHLPTVLCFDHLAVVCPIFHLAWERGYMEIIVYKFHVPKWCLFYGSVIHVHEGCWATVVCLN